jgi:hypothetical protein
MFKAKSRSVKAVRRPRDVVLMPIFDGLVDRVNLKRVRGDHKALLAGARKFVHAEQATLSRLCRKDKHERFMV